MVLSTLLTQLSRSAAARDVLEVRRITGAIQRHKLLIVFIVATVTSLAYYYLSQVPDLYRAQAKIVIEGDRQHITRIEDVNEPLNPGVFTNSTQSAILQSRLMAEKVISKLGIDHLPNPKRRKDAMPPSQQVLVTQFLSGLSVQPSDHSSVVTLEYISKDPKFAAHALNTLLDVYLEDQLQEKNSATHNATRWLAQRVEEMRNKVVDSENKLEQIRRSSDSVYIDGKSLYQDQLVELTNDQLAAKKARSEVETKIQQFDKAAGSPEELEASTFIAESPFMANFPAREEALEAKLAEMRTKYKEEHPFVQEILKEQKALQDEKREALQHVRMALVNERDFLTLRIQNIAHDITALRLPLEDENDSQISMRGLESEIEANKQLFNVLLARYKETDVQDEVVHAPDARVISKAYPPVSPFEPKREPVILAAFLLSVIAAIGLSMIIEFSAAGFQNSDQLELETGLQVISTIPEFSALGREVNHLHILDQTSSPLYAESIRNLRAALFDETQAVAAPKILLLSSSLPDEGKSSTALSLAVILQKTGKEVLLIDADMRRSQLAKSLKLNHTSGLGEYLAGTAQMQDVMYKDNYSGISCIPAGHVEGHPLDLLELPVMGQLLADMRKQFDVIIVDTPPVMSVRDATLVAPHADACLYMVRWEDTPRGAVLQGVKLLKEKFPEKPFSLALSRIQLRKQRYYRSGKEDYLYFTNYAFNPAKTTAKKSS